MDSSNLYPMLPIGERVAVLETKIGDIQTNLNAIDGKLDELLQLKAKGMGAIGLVSLLIGSGFIGIVYAIIQFFSVKPHI